MKKSVNCTSFCISDSLCIPVEGIIGLVSVMLFLSLCWNIYCCISKHSSGKGFCETRKRQSPKQMLDNPIYGNLHYSQSSLSLFLGGDPRPSSSMGDQHGVNIESQDCYANLTVKAPSSQFGPVSSLTHYSDVVSLVELPGSEREDEGTSDIMTTVSDLYASVQNQRTKTVQNANSGDCYANHL
ncbi:uncharacterized protein AB9W97_009006 [Spinachia spinachia]